MTPRRFAQRADDCRRGDRVTGRTGLQHPSLTYVLAPGLGLGRQRVDRFEEAARTRQAQTLELTAISGYTERLMREPDQPPSPLAAFALPLRYNTTPGRPSGGEALSAEKENKNA